ncbi:sensor histidine kinase [Halolamina sp. C58]|uniref:sensor histidine kinase n=1 Tax=Halolamina sp. C58 TaxID=3421640 RepID=UPI003EBA0648
MSEALRFVNGLIRHDLRNDLNVIRGHAQLVDSDAEAAGDSPSIIAEKADEALARIDTTGVVAETLSGEAELAPIDLAAIAAEIAKGVEATYSITVTTDIPEQAPVTANKGLRSVVDNLLENAVEHNDADDPQVHVDVDVGGETVELTVTDNGPGLSEEQKERVLSGQDGNSGGLSLVRTLVEGYDGELRIEDNDPRGSVFVVALPYANADPS